MAFKSVEQCLLNIFKDIELRNIVDFASKISVRRYNAAGDRIRSNFQYIDQNFPQHIDAIIKLLDHPNPKVVAYCAVAMQDLLHCPIADKRKGIEKVKQFIADETIDIPDKVWLSLIWIKRAERNLELSGSGDGSPIV